MVQEDAGAICGPEGNEEDTSEAGWEGCGIGPLCGQESLALLKDGQLDSLASGVDFLLDGVGVREVAGE